jgi:hypothetical protein
MKSECTVVARRFDRCSAYTRVRIVFFFFVNVQETSRRSEINPIAFHSKTAIYPLGFSSASSKRHFERTIFGYVHYNKTRFRCLVCATTTVIRRFNGCTPREQTTFYKLCVGTAFLRKDGHRSNFWWQYISTSIDHAISLPPRNHLSHEHFSTQKRNNNRRTIFLLSRESWCFKLFQSHVESYTSDPFKNNTNEKMLWKIPRRNIFFSKKV